MERGESLFFIICIRKPPVRPGVQYSFSDDNQTKYLNDIINLRSANCKIKIKEVLNDIVK